MAGGDSLPSAIEEVTRTLLAVAPTLPTADRLEQEQSDAADAFARGYFLPDEDERVKFAFSRYLAGRVALLGSLESLRPHVVESLKDGARGKAFSLEAFSLGLCAACMLVRSAWFLVDNYASNDVVWKKLDEAEPIYGIPRKQFSQIYRSLTNPRNIFDFFLAIRYARDHEAEIAALAKDPVMEPVVELLKKERPFAVALKRRAFVKGRIRYWAHSLRRRRKSGLRQVTFTLFEMSGRAVAEMRNPFHRKRVTPTIQRRIRTRLRPGDVFVTRHDDAMSNLFLPGFWPHAALYIGTPEERAALGIHLDETMSCPDSCFVEAKKDGVLLRPFEETLSVDAFTVVRPQVPTEVIGEAIGRALTQVGKLYDFAFDFCRSDRLVCTEVVYRSFHGIGGIEFSLGRRAGRMCLSAEDLLDHAIDRRGFEVVALFGTTGRNFEVGEDAVVALRESYRSDASD